jgi:hypothetical protein
LESLSRLISQHLQEAEELQKQANTVIEVLRSENLVLKESTIPVLVESHKLLLERYDAEISAQARYRAVVSPSQE